MRRPLLLTFALTSLALHAQIPNAGFETWSSASGSNEPAGWLTLNALGTLTGVEFATQVSPGAVGSSCIQLTTHEVPGFGIIPSIAATVDGENGTDGFPYAQRPLTLDGSLKFLPVSGDAANIVVSLSRWNVATQARETVGAGFLDITTASSSWTTFSIPVEYGSALVPDTATISIISSATASPQPGTALSIDDLHFSGTATAVEDLFTGSTALLVSPSPATDRLQVRSTDDRPLRSIMLFSTDGRLVRTERATLSTLVLDVTALEAGTYVVRAERLDGSVMSTRFTKQ
jgi:hypothetical protein